MKPRKRLIDILIFGIAVIVAVLGIVQLVLYIPAQLEMLKTATAQGATSQQISDYYSQQFIPQILTYLIQTLGISGILVACGMIYRRPINVGLSKSNDNKPATYNRYKDDEFFEGFDIIENKNISEGEQ